MRLVNGLNTAQRVVIVVAMGIALAAVGVSLARIGSPGIGGHVFLRSPSPFRPHPRLAGWLRLVIWLALDGIWAWASVIVFRTPHAGPSEPS